MKFRSMSNQCCWGWLTKIIQMHQLSFSSHFPCIFITALFEFQWNLIKVSDLLLNAITTLFVKKQLGQKSQLHCIMFVLDVNSHDSDYLQDKKDLHFWVNIIMIFIWMSISLCNIIHYHCTDIAGIPYFLIIW